MANVKTIQLSFGGGEISPEMFGRLNDAKFQSGLAICKNMIALPQGSVQNRGGFAYVRESKDPYNAVYLIPFIYSNSQSVVLEFGNRYVRFHTQGKTLVNPTTKIPLEVLTPYAGDDVTEVRFVQQGDVLTLVHPSYPPATLSRTGASTWVYKVIEFGSTVTAPQGVKAEAYNPKPPPDPSVSYSYGVTAIGSDGISESVMSAPAQCFGNLLVTNAKNTITWTGVAGSTRYNVYKLANGALYAYIGQSSSTRFEDENITPDMSATPPLNENPFVGTGNYPSAVTYYQQRKVFGGTQNNPQTIYMTRTGTEKDMNYSIPSRSDDSIEIRVASREANNIRHFVPMNLGLATLTNEAEWLVASSDSSPVSPSNIGVNPQSYIGSSDIMPSMINNTMIYPASRGGHMREMTYAWESSGYKTADLSLRASHLFDNKTIVDMDYAKAPYPIIWAVSSDGSLLGMTYIPDQQIVSWHRHETINGKFESVCVVPEGDQDVLYCVVRRQINGKITKFIERMTPRLYDDKPDKYFFVDCGASYSNITPVNTVSGLNWLEGQTVSILADGAVQPPRIVLDGKITLDTHAKNIQIGLPITCEMKTLPWFAQIDGALGQGRAKNVNRAYIRLFKSSELFVGPDEKNLTEVKMRTTEGYGNEPNLRTDELPIMLTPSWTQSGQVLIRHNQPLPLTLVSMALEVALGS